jgi:tRNA dimethylallyltransferase
VLQERYKLERNNYKFKIICITRERSEVYRRINERVETMFDKGLVDEVKSLLDGPKGLSKQAKQALGYKEVIEYLDGGLSLSDAKELVKLSTRRFAKRQMTWFRSFQDIEWLEAKEQDEPKVITDKVFSILKI